MKAVTCRHSSSECTIYIIHYTHVDNSMCWYIYYVSIQYTARAGGSMVAAATPFKNLEKFIKKNKSIRAFLKKKIGSFFFHREHQNIMVIIDN